MHVQTHPLDQDTNLRPWHLSENCFLPALKDKNPVAVRVEILSDEVCWKKLKDLSNQSPTNFGKRDIICASPHPHDLVSKGEKILNYMVKSLTLLR